MNTPKNITEIIQLFTDLGMVIMPLLASVGFFVFVLGIARFIKNTGNEKEAKDSKNMIIWGIIGVFVMVTIWGIIAFIKGELGFGGGAVIPQIQIR